MNTALIVRLSVAKSGIENGETDKSAFRVCIEGSWGEWWRLE